MNRPDLSNPTLRHAGPPPATVICPRCKGSGEGSAQLHNDYPGAAGTCGQCLGVGTVPSSRDPRAALQLAEAARFYAEVASHGQTHKVLRELVRAVETGKYSTTLQLWRSPEFRRARQVCGE